MASTQDSVRKSYKVNTYGTILRVSCVLLLAQIVRDGYPIFEGTQSLKRQTLLTQQPYFYPIMKLLSATSFLLLATNADVALGKMIRGERKLGNVSQ